MKNMSTDELDRFLLDMVEQENQKDAVILDLRYNTGGNVHDKVLNFLSQKPYLQWKYREGKMTAQPNFAPSGKPIVLLINEASLSDAEMTAAGFKALKLGKLLARTRIDGLSSLPEKSCRRVLLQTSFMGNLYPGRAESGENRGKTGHLRQKYLRRPTAGQ
jgi:hypothetical protein